MNLRYLHTLEFDKILARLAAHTEFSASEQLALAVIPSTEPDEIAQRQGETTQARALLDLHPEMSIGGARDIRPLTKNARIGALLQPLDLLEIRQTLVSARTLRRTLVRLETSFPRLSARAAQLLDLPVIVDAIARAINDRAEVADGASEKLASIRTGLNTQRSRLIDKLQRIVTSASNAKVVQEPIITQRDGRYVIPIRAEAKGRIPGLVHDTSASGATVFIEPLSTVEMGNRVRELENEERHEIERILKELAALVGAHADAIDATVETLAQLDLAFAKAKYSAEIRGVEPTLQTRGSNSPESQPSQPSLELLGARHPLLDPERVVPISVRLGDAFSILIITGPNTGGKTVTLKTVGLMALMAQSGLHIPAYEGSRLPVFDGVYADIGDEQSIEQSLSTFSSHLRNIVEILRAADSRSLVLLDELGAGTDPVEGSALARSILMHLLERKTPALVATHYAELKAFAHTTPGVQNASMEFDVETLSPTFQLTIGLPGQSNAFAIATRLGLAPAIIERARKTLTHSDIELENMLTEIKRTQQQALSERAHAEIERREAEQRAGEARRRLAEIESSREEIITRAHEEAEAEIQLAREELRRLRQEWRAVALTRDFVENEQTKLDKLEEILAPPSAPSPSAPVELQTQDTLPLNVGDHVMVPRLGQAGQILTMDSTGADVQVGSFRVHLKPDELGAKVADTRATPERISRPISLPDTESPGVEVSLRGLRGDDAIEKLEKYIDRAYLAGLPYVRVVHGKGTGTLRKLARDLLQQHPLVAQIREGEPHEGGGGVTVVKLVSR